MERKPVWDFSRQPNKFGYRNNPNWVADEDATPVHTPCGYWWKGDSPELTEYTPVLGEPLPFLAYVVEDPNNAGQIGYVMCDIDLNPMFFVPDIYNLYDEIRLDVVAPATYEWIESEPVQTQVPGSAWVDIPYTFYSSETEQWETIIHTVGHQYTKVVSSTISSTSTLLVEFTKRSVYEYGTSDYGYSDNYIGMTALGMFGTPFNNGYWEDPWNAGGVSALYSSSNNLALAKSIYTFGIGYQNTNLTTGWQNGYEEFTQKFFIGMRLYDEYTQNVTSAAVLYHAGLKQLIEAAEPSLIYAGSVAAAPSSVLGESLQYNNDNENYFSPLSNLYYYGMAQHREIYSPVISNASNNQLNVYEKHLMRNNSEPQSLYARSYDLMAIKAIMEAAGYKTDLVPTAANEDVDGNVILLYETRGFIPQ